MLGAKVNSQRRERCRRLASGSQQLYRRVGRRTTKADLEEIRDFARRRRRENHRDAARAARRQRCSAGICADAEYLAGSQTDGVEIHRQCAGVGDGERIRRAGVMYQLRTKVPTGGRDHQVGRRLDGQHRGSRASVVGSQNGQHSFFGDDAASDREPCRARAWRNK